MGEKGGGLIDQTFDFTLFLDKWVRKLNGGKFDVTPRCQLMDFASVGYTYCGIKTAKVAIISRNSATPEFPVPSGMQYVKVYKFDRVTKTWVEVEVISVYRAICNYQGTGYAGLDSV